MQNSFFYLLLVSVVTISACKNNKENQPTAFLTAKEAVRFNQLIYKDSINESFEKHVSDFEIVFLPKAIEGNYAIIAKNKTNNQYALVIRGSVIEFSNEGFQNFIMQDFNIFTQKKWEYADSVKEGYISKGTFIGFQNLLLLKDVATGLTIKEFIEKNIPANSCIVITGHSLGGNLAYPFAGYLKKVLPLENKLRLQLITFGAPAAGNAAFIQDIEEKFPEGESYITELDIAPVFPDIDQISKIAKLTGLDSVLQLSKLNLKGIEKRFNVGDLLNIAGDILEKTNIINKTNKYVQSQKHQRLLSCTNTNNTTSPLSVEAVFNRAYQFHKIDKYAELLGVGLIE